MANINDPFLYISKSRCNYFYRIVSTPIEFCLCERKSSQLSSVSASVGHVLLGTTTPTQTYLITEFVLLVHFILSPVVHTLLMS